MIEEGKHYNLVTRQDSSHGYRFIKVKIQKISVYGILCGYYLNDNTFTESDMVQINFNEIETITPLGY